MNNIAIIKELHQSLENKDFDRVSDLLTEDFVFLGPAPESVNKETFIATHEILLDAISEFRYHLSDLSEHKDKVYGSLKISGVHSAALDLSMLSGPILQPTNKEFNLPADFFQSTIQDGKVSLIISEPSAGGGLGGLIATLNSLVLEQA